jgi:uncharacterized protein (TIGR02145 family)
MVLPALKTLKDNKERMKQSSVIITIFLYWIIALASCRELPRDMAITTGEVSEVAINSAEVSGYIIDLGESPVQYGHCYAKTPSVVADCTRTELGIPLRLGNFTSNLSNLEAGCNYYIRSYMTDGEKIAYGEEKSFTTEPALLPELTTNDITSLTTTSAISGGIVINDGGAPVTECGICWMMENANPAIDPTVEDDHISNGSGTGSFISNIEGLNPGTRYKVRAYATNKTGTGYGYVITFKTYSVVPALRTTGISSLTSTSVTSGGNIIFNGGEWVTESGVCWSTSPNPTIANEKISCDQAVGSFELILTGLTPNTTYYMRAYSTSVIGTGYGNELSFKTYTGSVTDYDGNTYNTITLGSQVWFRENLRTTHYRNGDPVPNTTNSNEWINNLTAAYCWYNNEITYKEPYGALYNHYVVENASGICPAEYHVPSEPEWTVMINSIGQTNLAGGMLKDTTLWTSPNSGATNSSGFTALPTGCRGYDDAHFHSLGLTTWFWTSTLDGLSDPRVYFIINNSATITSYANPKRDGFSIRCIKD